MATTETNSINASTAGVVGNTGTGFSGSPATQYNVQVGGATSNSLANVAPSATSGVPLVSQGSSANPAFGTAVVAGGGTGLTSTTAYGVLCGGTTTTGNLQNAGAGSAGQVLTSNGASALPTWQAAAASGFTSINIQTFTGSGTYTPTANMKYCIIEVLGGGGAGGGTTAGGGSGGGGGSGEYARGVFTAATIGASKTVTIGAGGTGSSGSGGGGGGTTSVSTLITALGGGGGQANNSNSGGPGAGGTGGTQSGNVGSIVRCRGFIGSYGCSVNGGSAGGIGANSQFGMGGAASAGGTFNGGGAAGYGSGGGGGVGNSTSGGSGASGLVIITEYI